MNWMGGSLNRHSRNARKDVIKRQKQHFEKARKQLRDGTEPPREAKSHSYSEKFAGVGIRFKSQELRSLQAVDPASHADQSPPHRDTCRDWTPERSPQRNQNVLEIQSEMDDRHIALLRGESRGDSSTLTSSRKNALALDSEEITIATQRQRLLETQDWAGLASSFPVNMHFGNAKSKDRIGKRRKIQTLPQGMRGRTHHTDHDHSRKFAAQAGGIDADDIKIRIGTDALASQTPMQLTDHAHSHADALSSGNSSDPMLFDEEGLYASAQESGPRSRSVSASRNGSINAPRDGFTAGLRGDMQVLGGHVCASALDSNMRRGDYATKYAEIERNAVVRHGLANARPSQDTGGPKFQARQFFGNGVRGLPVVFDQHSDCSEELTLQNDNTIEQRGADTKHAEQHRFGPDKAVAGASVDSRARRASSASNDDLLAAKRLTDEQAQDEGPWRQFLAIPDDSSNCSMDRDIPPTDTLVPQQQATEYQTDRLNYPLNVSSQRTNIGESAYMTTPSCASDELPSTGYVSERTAPDGRPQQEGRRGESHGIDASEQLWKTFVFADDEHLATDLMQSGFVKRRLSMSSVIDSPKLVAYSLAVAPPVSPNFMLSEAATTQRSCIQDASCRVPHSRSFGTKPTPVRSSVEVIRCSAAELTPNEAETDGGTCPEASCFGMRQMEQASLVNNVSVDTLSSPTSSVSDHFSSTHGRLKPTTRDERAFYRAELGEG